jgi:hypothetical protein
LIVAAKNQIAAKSLGLCFLNCLFIFFIASFIFLSNSSGVYDGKNSFLFVIWIGLWKMPHYGGTADTG